MPPPRGSCSAAVSPQQERRKGTAHIQTDTGHSLAYIYVVQHSTAQLSSLPAIFWDQSTPSAGIAVCNWPASLRWWSSCRHTKSNTSSSCAMQSPTHHNMKIVSVAQWNCMTCLVSLPNEHTCWKTGNMHASPEATPYIKKCHTQTQPQPHPPTHLRSHESLICRPLLAQVAAAITAVRVQLLGPNSLKTSSLNAT